MAPHFGWSTDGNRIALDEVKLDPVSQKTFTFPQYQLHAQEAYKSGQRIKNVKDHESCVRHWFESMELVKPDPEAEEVMYWWPIVGETVVLSTHPHSGIPERFQGKIATITDVSEDGLMYVFYCSLTDQYARCRQRYPVQINGPRHATRNNPDGIMKLNRIVVPMMEPSAISWPHGDHLAELQRLARSSTSRILFTPGNIRLKKAVSVLEATSIVETVSRCISYVPSQIRRFTESFTQLYETVITAAHDLNILYNQAQRKILSIKMIGVNLGRQLQKSTHLWDMIRFTGNRERVKLRDTISHRNSEWTVQAGELLSFALQLLALIDRIIEVEELQQPTLVQSAFFTCPTLYDFPDVNDCPCYDKTSSRTHLATLEGMHGGNQIYQIAMKRDLPGMQAPSSVSRMPEKRRGRYRNKKRRKLSMKMTKEFLNY